MGIYVAKQLSLTESPAQVLDSVELDRSVIIKSSATGRDLRFGFTGGDEVATLVTDNGFQFIVAAGYELWVRDAAGSSTANLLVSPVETRR